MRPASRLCALGSASCRDEAARWRASSAVSIPANCAGPATWRSFPSCASRRSPNCRQPSRRSARSPRRRRARSGVSSRRREEFTSLSRRTRSMGPRQGARRGRRRCGRDRRQLLFLSPHARRTDPRKRRARAWLPGDSRRSRQYRAPHRRDRASQAERLLRPAGLPQDRDRQGARGGCRRLILEQGAGVRRPLPPSLRAELESAGVKTRQAYATADLGIIAYETDAPAAPSCPACSSTTNSSSRS